nr:MAG TPA: hypothetical protein [Bacteriophage sp.]
MGYILLTRCLGCLISLPHNLIHHCHRRCRRYHAHHNRMDH